MIIGKSTIRDLKEEAVLNKVIAALSLPSSYFLKSVVDAKKLINRYLKDFRDEVLVIVEDEYVDKVYRDIYSHFLSTKLFEYKSRCVKLSFLEPDVDPNTVLCGTIDQTELKRGYLGFMILRPICPGTVGRTPVIHRLL